MINLNDIKQAEERIGGYVHRTPLVFSAGLSRMAGADIYFKCENLQKTGSFKAREAFNRMLSLTDEEKSRGVVCYSSGNHAQAVSYAASVLGIKAWVFMPETAVPAKIAACRGYGAEVVLYGKTGADAYPKAIECMKEKNLVYIDPVEDYGIMSGQGTAGLEIMEDLPDTDAVYVPVGGGGLMTGVSTAVKAVSPNVKVIGVEPENMNCVGASFAAKKITKIERRYSIADGLAGDAPGEKAFEGVMKNVDEMITVSEEEIEKALTLIIYRTKMFIEPSSAVTLAGLMSCRAYVGKKNVCLLSGGNADLKIMAEIFSKNAVN